ncbi:efflux RND transporter permease subunit [Occallatibacter riparius]|uniref:Efflux RND transporter permease subunit n=1 Tax=Occallatibacter riparius TaxID=1002689 RepID=A0A9J7BNQ1_9BACT|nr:efflux RND transporter permease subunit [Occallatibacter riparius]UWZ82789.1 efflux RND transporter permease subunit [Occallatibacter riparius]
MWIVRLALNRPYTFIVLALLIVLVSPAAILRTPTDIFPNIDIPVIAVAWAYTGLDPEDIETRLTTPYEKALTTLVDNIQHIESTSYNGASVVKIYLQPGTSLDTANAQVVAVGQYSLRNLPPGIQPPEIINFSASSVPILQLGLSGKGMSEQALNDEGFNFLRPQLITVPGAVIPYPYGGKQRQVMIGLDQSRMEAKGISPTDVLNAVNAQNLILPTGTAKIAENELDVRMNVAPRTIEALNNIPIRQIGNTTIYLRDVARVSDGFAVQTNVVRQDGHRGVLVSILKSGKSSTLSVVSDIKRLLPHAAAVLPPEMKITPLADQSLFVRSAISGVIREGAIAGALTGLMILLFIGSWRSTLIIAISIPLSVLTSILALSVLGETINIMTLGGLALAVGILVDDATVVIENINRILEEEDETDIRQAILDGSQQVAIPALVSTLCICIVFMPLFLLSGVARFLFVPLAEAVVFAMLASYFFSRTLVPTLAMYMLKLNEGREASRNPFVLLQRTFERGFARVRSAHERLLGWFVRHRRFFVPACLALCTCTFLLAPWLGEDFFPDTDSGQFALHIRAKTGTRIDDSAQLADLIEASIRKEIPPQEVDSILDNIGLPYSPYNTMHSTSGVIGAGDADVLVTLRRHHHPTSQYVRSLRQQLPREFPGATFYFPPADIVAQILNFGIPAPIDVQVEGNNLQADHGLAEKIMADLRKVAGLTDLHIQQPLDYPTLEINVDRTKALQAGYQERDIASSVLNSLTGSFQTTPNFFVNWKNGVTYNLVAQTPQYRIQSFKDLQNIPISASGKATPEILADVASITRGSEVAVISHYNLRRVIDIYGAPQGRDLAAVNSDVQQVVAKYRKALPRGTFITIRGQVETMRESYTGLVAGLGFAIVLVYLLIVVNFQSWLDPFIIITAIPAAMAGIVLMLFFTHTHLSVPALMGALMCVGVATANSILVVSFAKDRLVVHGDGARAALEAGATRFRPVIMTALAMIIGMVPMALGLGDGGEQNAPLGRAVIGGLLCATAATLLFVPSVFALFHKVSPVAASLEQPEADRDQLIA